jgi:TPP-dependent pyruvate/acetoin dehydrogenase alpha subunit
VAGLALTILGAVKAKQAIDAGNKANDDKIAEEKRQRDALDKKENDLLKEAENRKNVEAAKQKESDQVNTAIRTAALAPKPAKRAGNTILSSPLGVTNNGYKAGGKTLLGM